MTRRRLDGLATATAGNLCVGANLYNRAPIPAVQRASEMAEVFMIDGGELRVATRELVIDGQLRALEPRPFDLLVHLLSHADRVVPRDELLDALWAGDKEAAGALARSVMKLRRALGPVDRIRTVHGQGYRYVGAVERLVSNAHSSAVLAVLPVVNASGQSEMDWVELGLLSLVLRALAPYPALVTVPIATLLAALEQVGTDTAARAAAVRQRAAAREVFEPQLHWTASGWRLVVTQLIEDGRRVPVAEFHAATPPALAAPFASWLLDRHGSPSTMATEADAAAALLGPALHSVAQQRWHLALTQLDALLAVAPDHADAQRERLRVLVALDDDRAFALGQALLDRAQVKGDRTLVTAARLELAQAFHRRRLNVDAKRHLDALLAEDAPYARDSHTALATTLLRASIALFEVDFACASRLLDDADRHCRAQGQLFERIRIEGMRLVVAAETGDMRRAYEHAERAATLYRDHGLTAGQARAECNVANASASLGRFRVAVVRAEGAVALSRSLGVVTDTAISASVLAGLYRTLKKPASLSRLVALLDEQPHGDGPRTELFTLVSRAQLALARGDDDRAVALLQQAWQEALAVGPLPQHFVLPLLAWAQVGAGRWLEALRTCDEMQALPTYARDRNVQGAQLHLRAQVALGSGDVAECERLLAESIAVTPEGWWHAHARIDAAWLCAERGDVRAARALTAGLADWLAECPAGRALEVRLLWLEGARVEARAAQAMLMAAVEGEPPGLYGELLGDAVAGGRVLTRV